MSSGVGARAAPSLCDEVTARLRASAVEGGLGIEVVSFGAGRVELAVALGSHGVMRDGFLAPVLAGVLADASGGLSVLADDRCPAPGMVTAALRLDRVRPVADDATAVRAVALCREAGDGGGYAAIELRDDTGRVVAFGTGVMASVATPARNRAADAVSPRLRMPLANPSPLPCGGADATALLPADPSLVNGRGSVHGGVVWALVARHQETVLQDRGLAHRVTGLDLTYLRPVQGEGVTVRTDVVQVGTRFGLLQSGVHDADGRVLVAASGTVTSAVLHHPVS